MTLAFVAPDAVGHVFVVVWSIEHTFYMEQECTVFAIPWHKSSPKVVGVSYRHPE